MHVIHVARDTRSFEKAAGPNHPTVTGGKVSSGWAGKPLGPPQPPEMLPATGATVPRPASHLSPSCTPRPSLRAPPGAQPRTSSCRAGRNPASPASLEVLGGAHRALLADPDSPELRLKPYEPFPVLGWNCHLETIFAAFFRSVPDVRLRRECLRTADGGAVALDWVAGDERSLPSEAPVLILLVRLHLLPFRCQRKGRGKRGRKGYVEYTDM